MQPDDTLPSKSDDPIRKANSAFYEKAKFALTKLFDSAKARNELHFAFSLAPEFRGLQDAGWNTALESQRDSVPKPGVARHELRWLIVRKTFPTATRLRPFRFVRSRGVGHNPVGVVPDLPC